MKFQFKIQPFQTEAAESVVKVFAGQPKRGEVDYRRDVGKAEHTLITDDDYETGYRNADVELTREKAVQ